MDIQLISLLAAIITIITGVLSLSKDLNKTSIIRFCKILCCYSMPILFIQQVITLTNLFQPAIMIIYIFIFSFKVITSHDDYKKFSDDKCISAFIIIIISIIMFFVGEFGLRDYSVNNFRESRTTFINNLNTYKINIEMFVFLKNNIFMTLCMFLDALNLFIIPYSMIFVDGSIQRNAYYWKEIYKPHNEKKHYLKAYKKVDNSENLDLILRESFIYSDKAIKLSILSYSISSGLMFSIVSSVIYLF